MFAHEARIRSRIWFALNLVAASALLAAFALQHASVEVYPTAIFALAGFLFLSVAAEAIYNGSVPANFGVAIERAHAPVKFWLVVIAYGITGLLILFKAV
jgi:hypothetical protein